jgi:hypothetical protein
MSKMGALGGYVLLLFRILEAKIKGSGRAIRAKTRVLFSAHMGDM